MIVKKRDDEGIFTVMDYLSGKVKFGVTKKSLQAHLADRGLSPDTAYSDCDKSLLRLCYADVLKWFVIGASKVNNTSDTDNGWTHSGGGYELSADDIADMKAIANGIYSKLEPESQIKRKSVFRLTSHGVMRTNTTLDGECLERYNR